MKVGLIGCGAMGSRIAYTLEESFSGQVDKLALCDCDPFRLLSLQKGLKHSQVEIYENYVELIDQVDFVIECSESTVSSFIARQSLLSQKDVMILSVGGLIKDDGLMKLAEQQKKSLFLPSGAIAGIDAFLALSLSSTIKKSCLTTRKPIRSVLNSKIWQKKSLKPESIQGEFCLFQGSAREAIALFPKNINVAVTLSLATLGFDRTEVSLYVSPEWTRNSHTIEVRSSDVSIRTYTESLPLANNNATSTLAFLSAIAVLKKYFSYSKIGV